MLAQLQPLPALPSAPPLRPATLTASNVSTAKGFGADYLQPSNQTVQYAQVTSRPMEKKGINKQGGDTDEYGKSFEDMRQAYEYLSC